MRLPPWLVTAAHVFARVVFALLVVAIVVLAVLDIVKIVELLRLTSQLRGGTV